MKYIEFRNDESWNKLCLALGHNDNKKQFHENLFKILSENNIIEDNQEICGMHLLELTWESEHATDEVFFMCTGLNEFDDNINWLLFDLVLWNPQNDCEDCGCVMENETWDDYKTCVNCGNSKQI